MTGPVTVKPAGVRGESRRRWWTVRRAADLAWVSALLIAVAMAPIARYYLLSWPGVVEWSLVVVIGAGIAGRTIADRRSRVVQGEAGRTVDRGPDDVAQPLGPRATNVVGWAAVVLLLPVAWACLVDPFAAALSFDWGPARPSGGFETVVVATFLVCPFLVGLLVWWLARGVEGTPQRLIVAIVVACGAGLLAYGSLGYLSPLLRGLL